MKHASPWVMIPARGGSRGVSRKNVRLLGGIPLLCHVVRTAISVLERDRVIVITDDDEIAAIASAEGVRVLREPQTTGLATLDEVAQKVAHECIALGASPDDIFLTLQATSPFIEARRITEALDAFMRGAGSVITVVDDRHLGWRRDPQGQPVPDYAARLNRQKLPAHLRESGGIIGCRFRDILARGTRIVEPIQLIEVSKTEALDIDDFSDWAVAEHFVSRRRIVIRADAAPQLGMGHVYRALAIAQELARHHVTLVTDRSLELGSRLLSQYPFPVCEVDGAAGFMSYLGETRPDIVILDQLDTEAEYVRQVREFCSSVVTFEDQGEGASEADLVVSDLYENLSVPPERQLSGVTNAILAPQFESLRVPPPFRQSVETVLVVFGGTDPSHLTEHTLNGLARSEFRGQVLVVAGPGVTRPISLAEHGLAGEVLRDVRYMPGVMRRADFAISSAGRTVTELLSCGVPVLCLCQNEKELTHTHASARYGVINLGLGELIGVDTIAAHINRLVQSPSLRRVLTTRAVHELGARSNASIIGRILEKLPEPSRR